MKSLLEVLQNEKDGASNIEELEKRYQYQYQHQYQYEYQYQYQYQYTAQLFSLRGDPNF
jgi:hypothetical protein